VAPSAFVEKKKRSDMLRLQSPKKFFGLLVSLFHYCGQFVAIMSTLVTLNVWSADEPLDWPLAADDGLVFPAFAALLDCCDP
jgi:hypothetical protein